MQLDRYDRQILELLQQDGRISNQDLADRIGLSPSPCLRRVRTLEEAGVITGYRAMLDAKKLGLSLMALIGISMDQHTPERFANLEASIAEIPEILECLLITGQQSDYQLKVVVRGMDATRICCSTRSRASRASPACTPVLCCAGWLTAAICRWAYNPRRKVGQAIAGHESVGRKVRAPLGGMPVNGWVL